MLEPGLDPANRSSNQAESGTSNLQGMAGGVLEITRSILPELPRFKSWRWLLLAITGCVTAGGIAVGALVWLISLPPTTNCDSITNLSADRERLYCAQQAAQTEDLPQLLAGLELLEEWTPEHPLYYEAQAWLQDWSVSVLDVAQERMDQGNYEGAVSLAEQIPPSSPSYDQAQAAIQTWDGIWNQGDAIYQQAQDAIRSKNWNLASQKVAELADLEHRHWNAAQTAAISRQILAEQQADRQFLDAINAAEDRSHRGLSRAITIVSEINPDTYTRQDAQLHFDQWSEALLAIGVEQWYGQEFARAIATSQRVALNEKFADDAQDLIWLSEARREAVASVSTWKARPEDSWRLVKAIAIASQIQPDSQLYAQAQGSIQSWQSQIQDLSQLHMAQIAAVFNQPAAYEVAIAHANQIGPDRQRRHQAQTLAAHWNSEIERGEDRPHLLKARRLAKAGTMSAYEAAIAAAKQVGLGRALRIEAQTLIAEWQLRIERLEDQPMLTEARSLASQGRWQEAIYAAEKIEPERALYEEAQAAIDDWDYQIWLEQERERERIREEAAAAAAQSAESAPAETVETEIAPPRTPAPSSRSAAPAPAPARRSAPSPRPAQPAPSPSPAAIQTEPAWTDPFVEDSSSGDALPVEKDPLKPEYLGGSDRAPAPPPPAPIQTEAAPPAPAPPPSQPIEAAPPAPAPPAPAPPPAVEASPAPAYAPPVSAPEPSSSLPADSVEQDLSQDDFPQDNLSQDNLSQGDFSQGDFSQEGVSQEGLSHEENQPPLPRLSLNSPITPPEVFPVVASGALYHYG